MIGVNCAKNLLRFSMGFEVKNRRAEKDQNFTFLSAVITVQTTIDRGVQPAQN